MSPIRFELLETFRGVELRVEKWFERCKAGSCKVWIEEENSHPVPKEGRKDGSFKAAITSRAIFLFPKLQSFYFPLFFTFSF